MDNVIDLTEADVREKGTRTSRVYQHFLEEDVSYKCVHCKKIYKRDKRGTSNLLKHLKRKYISVLQTDESPNTSITKFFESSRNYSANDIEYQILRFVVVTCQPFSIVESPDFKALIEKLNKSIHIPTRNTVKTKILSLYQEYKDQVVERLRAAPGKISVIVDCWLSKTKTSYQGIIASWINSEWEYEEVLLGLDILKDSHTGLNLASSLLHVMEKFKITNKILGVTTDNAGNCNTMFNELSTMFESKGIRFSEDDQRVRCFAHIVNLACQDAIKVLKVTGVSECEPEFMEIGMTDTDLSSEEEDELDEDSSSSSSECESPVIDSVSIYAKVRNAISKIRSSAVLSSKFSTACQLSGHLPKKLLLDVSTRWNSTYIMLQRVYELKDSVRAVIGTEAVLQEFSLTEQEWDVIQHMIQFLKPFEEATRIISKSKIPSMSLVASLYVMLFDHLEAYNKECDSPEYLINAATLACAKLNKYYPYSDGLVFILGILLDPRLKAEWYTQVNIGKEVTKRNKAIALKHWDQFYKSEESPYESENDAENFLALQMKRARTNKSDEFRRYLALPVEDCKAVTDVLSWWKKNQNNFPVLSRMAQDFLSVSGTGVPIERAFSHGPDLLRAKRMRLTAKNVRKLFCLRAWLTFEASEYNSRKMKGISKVMQGAKF